MVRFVNVLHERMNLIFYPPVDDDLIDPDYPLEAYF
jgi:hypothetical protein